MGRAIKSVITWLLLFLVFKVLLQEFDMTGWGSLVVSMLVATPVCILAMLIASILIKPSLYKETEKKIKQQQK